MSAKNNEGPAFPVVPQHDDMSLRDLFAVQASESDIECARPFVSPWDGVLPWGDFDEPSMRAKARYVHADRMLKARSK